MLKGKVIIVTGGSKGLGLAACKSLVDMGAKVGILARSEKDIIKAVAALGESNALGVAVDVADKASVESAFAKVHAHFGRLDGVVNNAGLARPNSIESMPVEDLHLQINTNFIGLVYCCQVAIPLLRAQGSGLIVNISSASVHHENEMSHLSIYAATKAAVEVFSRELRHEVTKDNIGVTVLVPGSAESEFGLGFDFGKLSIALHDWQTRGKYYDGTMKAEQIGQAIAHCFTYPVGVTVDFMEVKPHMPVEKPLF
jgi:NAD(P)-dependent dehydrogenase (short-subunit alcohol dehydrogenase family)